MTTEPVKIVTLKAYLCSSEDPEQSQVVFARSNGAAKFPYMREHDLDIDTVTVRRAPEYDAHTPGPVPLSALLDHGWFFECTHCQRRISLDEDFIENYSAEQLMQHAIDQAPHIAALATFDAESPRPEDVERSSTHLERVRQRQALEDWRRSRSNLAMFVHPKILSKCALRIHDDAGEVFCDTHCEQSHSTNVAGVNYRHALAETQAEARWPGCEPYESKRWPYLEPNVTFRAPGMVYQVSWKPGDEVHTATSDKVAWEAYCASLPTTDLMRSQAA